MNKTFIQNLQQTSYWEEQNSHYSQWKHTGNRSSVVLGRERKPSLFMGKAIYKKSKRFYKEAPFCGLFLTAMKQSS